MGRGGIGPRKLTISLQIRIAISVFTKEKQKQTMGFGTEAVGGEDLDIAALLGVGYIFCKGLRKDERCRGGEPYSLRAQQSPGACGFAPAKDFQLIPKQRLNQVPALSKTLHSSPRTLEKKCQRCLAKRYAASRCSVGHLRSSYKEAGVKMIFQAADAKKRKATQMPIYVFAEAPASLSSEQIEGSLAIDFVRVPRSGRLGKLLSEMPAVLLNLLHG